MRNLANLNDNMNRIKNWSAILQCQRETTTNTPTIDGASVTKKITKLRENAKSLLTTAITTYDNEPNYGNYINACQLLAMIVPTWDEIEL